jgi:hypothetical protein
MCFVHEAAESVTTIETWVQSFLDSKFSDRLRKRCKAMLATRMPEYSGCAYRMYGQKAEAFLEEDPFVTDDNDIVTSSTYGRREDCD